MEISSVDVDVEAKGDRKMECWEFIGEYWDPLSPQEVVVTVVVASLETVVKVYVTADSIGSEQSFTTLEENCSEINDGALEMK
ncbi:unnamed protein product [[Candida] boidinii]|nr:unnamed protein product [[Candida] boidinii]